MLWKDWNFYIFPNNGLQTRAVAICNATKDCLLNRTLATFKRYDPHSRYIFPIYEIYIYAIYQIYIFPMYMYNTWHIFVFPEKNGNIQEIRPTKYFENQDFAKSFGVTWHIFVFPEKVRLISLEGTIYPVFCCVCLFVVYLLLLFCLFEMAAVSSIGWEFH